MGWGVASPVGIQKVSRDSSAQKIKIPESTERFGANANSSDGPLTRHDYSKEKPVTKPTVNGANQPHVKPVGCFFGNLLSSRLYGRLRIRTGIVPNVLARGLAVAGIPPIGN